MILMDNVIKLETPDEDIFSEILNLIFYKALNGDKKFQMFLEKKIFSENWKSIQKKYKTEGSIWYVWWMDGVHTLMHERKIR